MGTLTKLKMPRGVLLLSAVVSIAVVACSDFDSSSPSVPPAATHTVSVLIEEGTGDPQWFRDIAVPQGSDAYQVLEQVTAGDLEATWHVQFRSHFVESIFGVENEGGRFWRIFLWDDFDAKWTPLPFGADWFSVKDGHVMAWLYADTSQFPADPPSQIP
jgi:hypothetical protein